MTTTTSTPAGLTELELSGFRKAKSTRERIVRGFLRNWSGLLGLIVLLFIVAMAVFADQLACNQTCPIPYSPTRQQITQRLKPPFFMEGASPNHILGTDNLGRDLASRLIHGSRASLTVAILAGLMSVALGLVLGLISGYFGGTTDAIIQRVADAQQAFPFLVIAIAVIAITGPSIVNLILLIGYWGWVRYAKVTRGQVLSAREKEYVEAARVVGASTPRILFRHLLPNVVSPTIVILTLSLAGLIVAESSLSFLGLGIQPPTPSWGSMLSEGRAFLDNGWWISTFAGLAIAITVLSINLLGDAVRDVLDPRLRT